jgi:hypothetical protein
MSKDFQVISRTIYHYYLDRTKEFKNLTAEYNQCCCMMRRRRIRQRREELLNILKGDHLLAKYGLMHKLGIPYKEIKDYPHLIDIEMKSRELKRELA